MKRKPKHTAREVRNEAVVSILIAAIICMVLSIVIAEVLPVGLQ